MADLAFPAAPPPLAGFVQGRGAQTYTGTVLTPAPGKLQSDLRNIRPNTGTISDLVVLKTGAGEAPFLNGRVWLLRAADGYKAWEGWTDAAGAYTATGLELGVEYVAMAIDPTRTHKTTGAGPVLAT